MSGEKRSDRERNKGQKRKINEGRGRNWTDEASKRE